MNEGDAITMLTNVGKLMNDFIGMFSVPCYVVGLLCGGSGLVMLTSTREGATGKGIMLIFIAGIFASLPYFISDLGASLALNNSSVLSFDTPGKSSTVKKAAVFAIFAILRVVGICAIYKGCNRLKFYNLSPNSDPRLISEAMTLIGMGGITTFAKEFVILLGNSVGGPVKTHIDDLFAQIAFYIV